MEKNVTINRYVNILMDKWFKRILGAEANKETLLALLRGLIPERDIMDIFYNTLNFRKKSFFEDGHDAVFDVECIDARGSRFVVEMQRERQVHFHERALFYATFPIQEQVLAKKKEQDRKRKLLRRQSSTHDAQFDYPPVYIISFLNFSLHKNTEQVLFRYDLREQTIGDLMTDRINFIFLEMTNFRKTEPTEDDSFAEKLSYALTHMSILENRPMALIEQVFGLLFEACNVNALTAQEQQEYTRDAMTTKMDRENILYTKWLDGKEEGLAEGRAEMEEERRRSAAQFKRLGVSPTIISEATGLSLEEIEAL
ncbi:MAG: PD-(D/E)XK nuclease family transposase [Bacteroidales bacterium]|nr:PD-(D/E)XK nuclease family transposase [Bacteroidales bacterium]